MDSPQLTELGQLQMQLKDMEERYQIERKLFHDARRAEDDEKKRFEEKIVQLTTARGKAWRDGWFACREAAAEAIRNSDDLSQDEYCSMVLMLTAPAAPQIEQR